MTAPVMLLAAIRREARRVNFLAEHVDVQTTPQAAFEGLLDARDALNAAADVLDRLLFRPGTDPRPSRTTKVRTWAKSVGLIPEGQNHGPLAPHVWEAYAVHHPEDPAAVEA